MKTSRDGVMRTPLRLDTRAGIFLECTVAVEGHYCKLCKVVVEPYK